MAIGTTANEADQVTIDADASACSPFDAQSELATEVAIISLVGFEIRLAFERFDLHVGATETESTETIELDAITRVEEEHGTQQEPGFTALVAVPISAASQFEIGIER